MWLDRVTVVKTAGRWPPTERQVADLLAPAVAGPSLFAPVMVIDGRPASARVGSTATYRLLSAFGLELIAPVAVSCVGVEAAYEALDSLIRVCTDGGPALVVTAARAPSAQNLVACWLVAAGPMTAESAVLAKPPLSETPAGGNGFMNLLAAVLAVAPSSPLNEVM
jgi:hypothetical protein